MNYSMTAEPLIFALDIPGSLTDYQIDATKLSVAVTLEDQTLQRSRLITAVPLTYSVTLNPQTLARSVAELIASPLAFNVRLFDATMTVSSATPESIASLSTAAPGVSPHRKVKTRGSNRDFLSNSSEQKLSRVERKILEKQKARGVVVILPSEVTPPIVTKAISDIAEVSTEISPEEWKFLLPILETIH